MEDHATEIINYASFILSSVPFKEVLGVSVTPMKKHFSFLHEVIYHHILSLTSGERGLNGPQPGARDPELGKGDVGGDLDGVVALVPLVPEVVHGEPDCGRKRRVDYTRIGSILAA